MNREFFFLELIFTKKNKFLTEEINCLFL